MSGERVTHVGFQRDFEHFETNLDHKRFKSYNFSAVIRFGLGLLLRAVDHASKRRWAGSSQSGQGGRGETGKKIS